MIERAPLAGDDFFDLTELAVPALPHRQLKRNVLTYCLSTAPILIRARGSYGVRVDLDPDVLLDRLYVWLAGGGDVERGDVS